MISHHFPAWRPYISCNVEPRHCFPQSLVSPYWWCWSLEIFGLGALKFAIAHGDLEPGLLRTRALNQFGTLFLVTWYDILSPPADFTKSDLTTVYRDAVTCYMYFF